jgi:hypothetical protein
MKKKMGRPPIKPENRRSYLVNVRITEAERLRFERMAKKQGLTISELLMGPWRS